MGTRVKLSDSDIKEVKGGRRAFLVAGLGATGLLAALTANACSSSDRCDADTQTDADARDSPNRPKDRCDTDGR
jgi:threonine dehydrogenase-like Zn-dependent dehydrogenase